MIIDENKIYALLIGKKKSTGFPGKNIMNINGQPSCEYGFQAATMQALTGAIGDTSAHTFSAQYAKETGQASGYIGRNVNDLNNDSGFRASCHITVMEIAA